MQAIRIPEAHWGIVWRALVASGPVSRISQEPVYLVSDRQVRMLCRKKLPFKLVPLPDRRRGRATPGSGPRRSSTCYRQA